VFGEVGLAGEIRGTSQASLRLREAAQMGFTRVVVPDGNVARDEAPAGCEIVPVRNVGEALDELLLL
jgi:DNA repair protein RadA/Sms